MGAFKSSPNLAVYKVQLHFLYGGLTDSEEKAIDIPAFREKSV
jgi:hypothetical protein